MDEDIPVGCIVGGLFAVVAIFFGLLFGIPWVGAYNSVDAGHVAVVRDGGWFNGPKIKGILNPASPMTNTGMYSTLHEYPAQSRTYTISADPSNGDKAGVDVVSTSSSDGVQMSIEGTLHYTLNLDPTVLEAFDNKYGTRSYTFNGTAFHAYDGDDGWAAFMNTQVRPVIDNDLRQVIADTRCAQLNAACALVKDSAQVAALATGTSNNVNYAQVQKTINSSLQADIDTQLGTVTVGSGVNAQQEGFLTGVQFTLVKADLPQNVQDAANKALAAFAQVSQEQALVQQAQLQAQANAAKQAGYNACPSCAVIDELKALPPNLTTFAPGAGGALAIK